LSLKKWEEPTKDLDNRVPPKRAILGSMEKTEIVAKQEKMPEGVEVKVLLLALMARGERFI
jgi:hypothetical protein